MQVFSTPPAIAFRRPWPGTLRGLVLWFFSLAFIALGGINYIATPLPARTDEALSAVLFLAPAPAWGWVMVAIGLTSAFSAYCHKNRDTYGFVLLAGFCASWGMGYVAGYVLFGAGLRSVGGAVIWLLFAAILTTVSRMPNAPLVHRARPLARPLARRGGRS